MSWLQADIAEVRAAAQDARRKLAATQQRLELMVGRSMLQGGMDGVASASAPASPAQQHRPPRPGVLATCAVNLSFNASLPVYFGVHLQNLARTHPEECFIRSALLVLMP